MDETERSASAASSRALDALNVFLADVRDGLGPYLAIYLTMRHWDPGRIGIAMSAMGIATVAAQTPAGALIDRTRHKRPKKRGQTRENPLFSGILSLPVHVASRIIRCQKPGEKHRKSR